MSSFFYVARARPLTVPASIATAYAVRYACALVLAMMPACDDVKAMRYACALCGYGVACGVSCGLVYVMCRY